MAEEKTYMVTVRRTSEVKLLVTIEVEDGDNNTDIETKLQAQVAGEYYELHQTVDVESETIEDFTEA